MSVHKKLMQARIELQGTQLKKSGLNKFAGYSYFELGDFLVPALQIFDEVGLCAVVSFCKEEALMQINDVEDGGCIYITSPMAEAPLKGTHPIQQVGACQTYSRRYLWVAALEIVEHDALEAVTASPAGVDIDALVGTWKQELEACTSIEDLRSKTKEGVAVLKKTNPDAADKLKGIAVEISNNMEKK
jgi:hypothetical protein